MTQTQIINIAVGEAARLIHPALMPRVLSDHLYRSRLGRDLPVVSGRKLIPVDLIDALRIELRRAGRLPEMEAVNV